MRKNLIGALAVAALVAGGALAQTTNLFTANNTWTVAGSNTFQGPVTTSGALNVNGTATFSTQIAGLIMPNTTAQTASTTHSIAGGQTALLSAVTLVNAANANDAVGLPVACGTSTLGATVLVISVGSTATMNVYPQNSSDAIDGGTAGSSVTLTAVHRGAYFVCDKANNWVSFLIGAVSS